MDKGLLIFVTIGLGAVYFLTNVVGEIQDDVNYSSSSSENSMQYEQYYAFDVVGDRILKVENLDAGKQLKVWNESELKLEFLELFPDFEGMKKYVGSRVEGDPLQKTILKKIDSIEFQFLGGTLSGLQAKSTLESIE